ncbi:MAG: choice-of-anchor tandem repeat GloVer-containing protein, partial [Chthoniobacteraceae bacterium]
LWGTTPQGGASALGTIFKFNPASGVFTTVVEFAGANGGTPEAGLVSDGAGFFWGTTRTGGADDLGTVFKIAAATGVLTTVVEFTGVAGAAIGSAPMAELFRDAGGMLWSTTLNGGAGNLGTVFKLDPATGALTTVVEFTGTNGAFIGSAPQAPLVADAAGILWGTTHTGGATNMGTVFTLDPATGTLATLVDFAGTNGADPRAGLVAEGAVRFWGTTWSGGADDLGTIFSIDMMTHAHTVVADFTGSAGAVRGAYPHAALVRGVSGELWGTASQGGLDDRGTIFKVLTATSEVQLVAEPEFAPVAPVAAVKLVPAASGAIGTPITLRGTAKDNIALLSVVVSINGGPFLPATLTAPLLPGKPFTWQLDVIPENGINVVIIKSVDSGGNASKPVKLVFKFTVTRPELAGNYSGLLTPELTSATPLDHTGVLALKVTATGRFTGRLTLGGRAQPLAVTGSIGNSGAARFGKAGTTSLLIARRNLPRLLLALEIDVAAPVSGTMTGTLDESDATVAMFDGSLAPAFNARTNPVPDTLLDPATDRGAYTFVLAARTPAAQGLAAEEFPQGDGFGSLKISPTGRVKAAGKLADGTSFSAGGALRQEGSFSFYAALHASKGAISGLVLFVETPGVSDASAEPRWLRPAMPRATAYRDGWPDGITVDFIGSKYIAQSITAATPLGNAPSAVFANGVVALSEGNLPDVLNNLVAIPFAGASTDLSAPPGGTAATRLKFSLLSNGMIRGSFTHPASTLPTVLGGTVLQKTQTGGGYFLAAPVGGVRGDPKQSGRVELQAQ